MIIRYSRRLTVWLPVVSTVASLAAKAQMEDVEPRWLRLEIPQASVGMDVEGLMENETVSGVNTTHQQLSLAPVIGLQTSGSIYHPDLLSFNLSGEDGWGWVNDTVSSPGAATSFKESDNLLRYLAQVNILPEKPYNATFTAAQDHTVRTYDAFDSYTVDSVRDNGHFGWITRTLELNADLGYRDEQSTGLSGSTELIETFFNFSGTQKRQNGQSTLTYRYDEFENAVSSGSSQNSVNNSVSLSDTETFGGRKQINASTGVGFSDSQYSGQEMETVTANENITVKQGPKLDSYLMLNYNNSSLDLLNSSTLQGAIGLRHRLFDSLTTSLDLHGNYDESSSPSSSSVNDQFGIGIHEDYTKRLSDWARLSAGVGVVADHDDQNSSGVLTVISETHNLTSTLAFLNNPKVIVSTIQVRAASDNTLYLEGTDYTVTSVGELTGIQLILGSLNVANHGSQVLVNYQSDSLNNASFEAVNISAQIRLDLFNQLGIYGRVNKLDNNAPPAVLTQTLTDLTVGMDYTRRWFRASAEYQDYDSSFIQYQAWRFLQSFNYQFLNASRIGVDIGENFYRYSGNLNQDQYQIVARYNAQFEFALAWYVEGGYVLQDMTGTEQDSGFARTGFSWSRGKLSVRVGYEYDCQTTTTGPSTDESDRNYFFMYLKRTF